MLREEKGKEKRKQVPLQKGQKRELFLMEATRLSLISFNDILYNNRMFGYLLVIFIPSSCSKTFSGSKKEDPILIQCMIWGGQKKS